MVAQGREEAILSGSLAKFPAIRVDELAVKLADIVINGLCSSIRIVVIANGNDELRIPAYTTVRGSASSTPMTAKRTTWGSGVAMEVGVESGWVAGKVPVGERGE